MTGLTTNSTSFEKTHDKVDYRQLSNRLLRKFRESHRSKTSRKPKKINATCKNSEEYFGKRNTLTLTVDDSINEDIKPSTFDQIQLPWQYFKSKYDCFVGNFEPYPTQEDIEKVTNSWLQYFRNLKKQDEKAECQKGTTQFYLKSKLKWYLNLN